MIFSGVQIIFVISVLAVLIALAHLLISAWYEVRRSPRAPMMMCDRHGPLMEKQTVTFLDTQYCWLCFSQKLKGK